MNELSEYGMDRRKTVSLVAVTNEKCRILLPHDLRSSISIYLAAKNLSFLPYVERIIDPPDPFKHDASTANAFTVIWKLRLQARFNIAKAAVEAWIAASQFPIEFHTGMNGRSWDWVLTFVREPALDSPHPLQMKALEPFYSANHVVGA